MAARWITDTIKARKSTRSPTVQEAIDFLNTQSVNSEGRVSRDIKSLYSVVRGCYHRLGAKLIFTDEEEVNLEIGDTTIPVEKSTDSILTTA